MRRSPAVLLALLLLAPLAGRADRSATEMARDELARQMDIGESAPDWLMDSETYAFSAYGSGGDARDWEALATSKATFVTHCPVNSEYFDRCHKLGVRCFPYVTFYHGQADRTYLGVNLKDHPEFIEVDEQGNLRRSGFWEAEDDKNSYLTCPNVRAYQDAMVAWVRRVMGSGADGVFVDCLIARSPCFGPRFAQHEHEYEGTADHALAMLLKRIREVVKEYKPDGAVLGNSAAPLGLPREYWKYLDADMLESYICSWASKDRSADWAGQRGEQAAGLAPLIKAGKAIQALSYLGHTSYSIRDDAFYCYASARLGGYVWSGALPVNHPDLLPLTRIRLGRPVSDEIIENGVHYRIFEAGFVALNPDKQSAAEISIKPPMPTTALVDLFGEGLRDWISEPGSNDALDGSVRHNGSRSLRMANSRPSQSMVVQAVTLNQTTPTPFVAGGWSKAQDVSGAGPDGDYAVYLDIAYADGTYLWRQFAPFTPGTHDWEYQSVVVQPEKPIRAVFYTLLFRTHTGTAWFADLSLKEGDDPERGIERLRNGSFAETGDSSQILELPAGATLSIPADSGRVYLFGSTVDGQLMPRGPRLTVRTDPPMGNVRFRVDGFDFWTRSGCWTTEYTLGPQFGQFTLLLDAPGRHTVEIADVVPAPMRTPAGYFSAELLGEAMDPSNPTQPMGNKTFRFREWTGPLAATTPEIRVEVSEDTTLAACYDVAEQ